MRDSVLLYRNQCEALMGLDAETFKKAVVAIWQYALNDKPPDGDPVTVAMWLMVKPLIDANNTKAQSRTNRNKLELAGTERNKPEQTGTEKNKPELTGTNRNRQEQTGTDRNKQELTGTKQEIINKKQETRKEKIKDIGRFAPPDVSEVQAFIDQHGYGISAWEFVDHYASQEWRKGNGQPISDWKACVRNWDRNQRQGMAANGKRQGTTTEKTNSKKLLERKYDWDELENKLLNAGNRQPEEDC